MPRYRAFGRTIASTFALHDLPAGCGDPVLTVSARLIAPRRAEWFEIWPEEGTSPGVRGARLERGYCIEYEASSRFEISAAGDAIHVDPGGCPPSLLQHRLLDQVIPLALSLEHVVLHASVAAIGQAACAFIGPAGAGKSSLALACADAGWRVLADDAIVITPSFTAVPSYPGVRVLRENRRKERIACGRCFDDREVPLATVAVIDADPAPAIAATLLSPRSAAVAVLGQMFRLEQHDRGRLERELSRASALAAAVPAVRLAFPRDGNARAVVAELGRHM
jgi:hypothetical protein